MTTYLEFVGAGRPHQAAAVSVGQAQHDLFRIHGRQCIEQVGDVEADLDLIALVGDLNLVLGFFLFGVMCLDRDEIWLQIDANSAILLIRENRGSLQGLAQAFAVRFDLLASGWQESRGHIPGNGHQ